MGNMISYLKWRGDISIAECPFGMVDNLILSELAYLDFSNIVPTLNETGFMTLQEAIHLCKENKGSGPIIPLEFLDVIAKSKRFQTMRLFNYIDETDTTSGIQFSALHIQIDKNNVYISFCGTNDEILGWREDFSMSYQVMPSQKKAVEYLEETMNQSDIKYFVGGHSKGGNLAVYGAACCSQEKQEKILKIYSNDGPGLCSDIIQPEKYLNIQHKVIRIIPEFSLIGKLFERDNPDIIVKSSIQGIMAHDGFAWEVEGDHFVTTHTCHENSCFINEIINTWIQSASLEQRKAFTKDFFDALEASGAKKMSEIPLGIDGIESILMALIQSENKTKIVILKFLQTVMNRLQKTDWKTVLKTKEIIVGILCFFIGLIILAKPLFASKCMSIVLGVITLFQVGRHLIVSIMNHNDNHTYIQWKISLCLIIMGVIITLLNQINFVTGFTELLVSCSFFVLSYDKARKAFSINKNKLLRCCYGMISVVSLLFGILPMTTYALEITAYTFTVGTFILLYGIVIIVKQMYRER